MNARLPVCARMAAELLCQVLAALASRAIMMMDAVVQ